MQRFLTIALALLSLPALAIESGAAFRDPLHHAQQGSVRQDSAQLGPELVALPAGSFILGDSLGRGNDNERPPRLIHIQQPFALGRYEVTFADWQLYADATGKPMPDNEGWSIAGGRRVTALTVTVEG